MTATKSGAWLLIVSVAVIHSSLVTDTQSNATRAVRRFAHVLDLTHALDEDTPYIPVPNITFPFKKTPIATVAKNGVATPSPIIQLSANRHAARSCVAQTFEATFQID
jgi:hypothetical protein